MASQNISVDRIKKLNDCEPQDGKYTLYWMQQSQRAELNHALEFAIQRANENNNRLLVAFAITDDYPEANLRHFHFMLEGLQQVEKALKARKIKFVVRLGEPSKTINELANDASEVVCDRGYLRHQVSWRRDVANHSRCRVWQIESDAIVPVEVASDKREYAARTIRSQLNNVAEEYYHDLATTPLKKDSIRLSVGGVDISNVGTVLEPMSVDRSVEPAEDFVGGISQAKQKLDQFMENRLSSYADRTDILNSKASCLSPYLHFGQISPLEIALQIRSSRGHRVEQKEAFLEELLVRRELAINFVHFEKQYDSLDCLPEWAAKTLNAHEDDEREYQYTATELEEAKTHDPAWNAAMIEMKLRGYLHNHLRMYWGKKIIEWTNTTGHAYRTAMKLNNRYFLDGRDHNSYVNVLWLFGLHDRAHQERPIFGKVRYMSFDGLKRKFDVSSYIERVSKKYQQTFHGTDDDQS